MVPSSSPAPPRAIFFKEIRWIADLDDFLYLRNVLYVTRTKILVAFIAVIVSAGVLVLKLKTKVDWDKLQSIEVYTDSASFLN